MNTLSSIHRPPHAFPTTYPPPIRPPTEISSVEWRHTQRTQPSSPLTSNLDVDSLCLQFAKSLVIEENPIPSPTHKASIFSLPVMSKGESDIPGPRAKSSRRNPSQRCRKPPATKSIPAAILPKTVKSRQLSLPPLPTSSPRPTPRKASAPTVTSPLKPVPPMFSNPHRYITPMSSSTPPTNVLVSGLDTNPRFSLASHSVYPQLSFDSPLDSATFIAQNSSYPPSAPATPPTVAPDLYSEPVVVSPIQFASDFFPTNLTDPFAQFQLQYDHLLRTPLISPSGRNASSLGLVAGDPYPKGAFSTLFESDYIPGEVF